MERLIREIFLRKGSGFVLKGGSALRALYGEHRLTKDIDLDFTNPKRTAQSLQNTISKSIERAALGLRLTDLSVSRPGISEQSPKWKVNFKDEHGDSYHVEIEVSRDKKREVPGNVIQAQYVASAAPGIAKFWVDVYDGPALVASKLAAVLGRGLPRDVYDLHTLKDIVDPPDQHQIRWAIQRAGLGDEKPVNVLHDRLAAVSWERFQSELQGSLSVENAERIDESEWSAIVETVADYASDLLQAGQA
jgi:predicted nucleotidyltransferase component of viral defense system